MNIMNHFKYYNICSFSYLRVVCYLWIFKFLSKAHRGAKSV